MKLPAGQMGFFDLPLVEVVPSLVEVVPKIVPTAPGSVPELVLTAVEAVEPEQPGYGFVPVSAILPAPIPEVVFPEVSSVTFHKSKKRLLMKANDVWAAELLREIKERLNNDIMRDFEYLSGDELAERIEPVEELNELWRWVLKGLDEHPYTKILEGYGLQVNVSPSLAGYMRKSKKRMQLDLAPFPCYESSNDDLTQCIQPNMILRCIEQMLNPDDGKALFELNKRYMVAGVNDGMVRIYTTAMQGAISISGSSETHTLESANLNHIFEDADKYVVGETIVDLFPNEVKEKAARLESLPIGSKLFKHVRQDVPTESLKSGFLCSKEMRMGKSSEGLSVCEVLGSQKIAWIGPSDAQVDTVGEFAKRDVHDYQEVTRLCDLDVPAKYHIMTFDFLKGGARGQGIDPLLHTRRGNTEKTWLRAMGDGKHEAECPHCEQLLERPVKALDVQGRVVMVDWVTANGYLCRNPECTWDERHWKVRKSGRHYVRKDNDGHASTHAGAAWDLGMRKVGHRKCYIDWARQAHAECGDHVGRRRMCPKCGQVDATWSPGIYKRLKKRYKTVVIDEAHMVKDSSSGRSKAALDFRGKHHITLTGTPISNNLTDMFEPLLWTAKGPNLRFPYGPNDKSKFNERFCENILIQREGSLKGHYKTLPYPKNPSDLWGFLAPLVVRRTRADAVYLESLNEINLKLPTVPPPEVLSVRMVPEQALLMLSSIETFREDFAEYVAEVEAKGQGLNDSLVIGQMSRMKIAATVPEMLNKKGKERIYNGEPMGGKARCLRTLIPAKIMEGKKVVLLSDFVMMRDLLHTEFAHLNPTFMRSGNVQVKKKLLAKFRETDSPLLIAGPQQISRGIDLSCADVMISCDLMWKAADQAQSLARLMGATPHDRIVELYILNSENSIDEHIFKTYFGKIAGAEHAIDHRVITRTARDTNWKSFVDQIVVQEELIANFLRDTGGDEGILLPYFEDDGLMERAI